MTRFGLKSGTLLLFATLIITQVALLSAGGNTLPLPGPVLAARTVNPTASGTDVVTPAPTRTATATSTETPTDTPTSTSTSTETPTDTPTETPSEIPTDTPTSTSTLTETPSETPTDTPTSTSTPTETPTDTLTPIPTSSETDTPTLIPSNTPTDIPTSIPTDTPTEIPTDIPPTFTPTTPPGEDCTFVVAPADVYGEFGLVTAIVTANAAVDPDIICLAPDSTYTLNQVLVTRVNSRAVIGLPVINTPVTLRGYGATLTRDTSAAPFSLLSVGMEGDLRLENIILSFGSSTQGGAVLSYGTLSLDHTALINNMATGSGGAIFVNSGTVSITGSTLMNNQAQNGGGIYLTGDQNSVTIDNSIISANTALSAGGGLFNFDSAVTLTNSLVSLNQAAQGAGIRNQFFGTLTINSTLISENTATTSGGGVMTDSALTSAGTSCFVSNNAPTGSAVLAPSIEDNPTPVDFTGNWWGHTELPSATEVTGNVSVDPALTVPPAICNH